jgi:hypothetical protein
MGLLPGPVGAQSGGRVVGRVLDAGSGRGIAGAVVEVSGTTLRATSQVDGRFTLTDVPPGMVALRARMIGYTSKLVSGIAVQAASAVTVDITLSAETVQLEELKVSVEAERGSVSKALDEQRHAANIINAITAEQISRSPDSDAGEAVKRVSGVSVQDGKYVFVRGLGERYTTTSLNGVRIPSPEQERKVVPLDLFPAGLLESISTSKTFTPDQAGDFSGASVNLKTREFPAQRVATFSMSFGRNSSATGNGVVSAPTVGPEWLGFGGAARQLPAVVADAGDFSEVTEPEQRAIINSFRNAWSSNDRNGLPNGSMGLSVGGEDPVFGQRIGYIGSLTYSYSQETRAEETKGLAQSGATPGTAVPYNTYTGSSAKGSVLWGGMLNLSTRLGTGTRLSFNNTYTRGGDNEASVLAGYNEEFGQTFQFTRLLFVERSVRSSQLEAEHQLGGRSLVNWSVASSGVTRDEPDRSDLGYTAQIGEDGTVTPQQWFGAARFATRSFGELDESGWDFGGSYQYALSGATNAAVLKIGGAYRTVTRDADTRAYDIINRSLTSEELSQPAEVIFNGAYADQGALLARANAFGGRYAADDRIGAGFVMMEAPVGQRIRIIAGARVESWALDVTTLTVQGEAVPASPHATDVLPSLAVNVALSGSQNLRFSASQTLSRPEYRELSPVPYFEQVGLLTTFGNPDLQRALIQNYDARWEWFPRAGETFSVGLFAKHFDQPIEKIIVLQAGAPALSFVNAEGAMNYGVEVEGRKNLSAVAEALTPFTVFANATLMRSEIEPGSTVLTNAQRPMVGQSPYVVNAGLTYQSLGGSISAAVLYNATGRRISEAGASGLPDTYEEARHVLDASFQTGLFQQLTLRLDGKNLLNSRYHWTQGGVTRHSYLTGRSVSVGLTWRP